MSQITKIVLRVILERIRGKIRREISEEQYGFMQGKGTRNAIYILRMLSERAIEMQRDLFICFIDYEKAFDRVRHEDLIEMLQRIGLDGKDLRLITNLYWEQKAIIEIENNKSNWFEIKRGVRQGCVGSPDLFSFYGENIMREIEEMEGLKVGGKNIDNIRYADDTALVADSKEKLQELLTTIQRKSEEHGLNINTGKTEILVVSKKAETPRCNIHINNKQLKQVDKFCYLGSTIKSDGRCDGEIKKRIAEAKNAFNKMRNFLTNKNISLQIRKRGVKTFVWSVMTYGAEAWTISNTIWKNGLRHLKCGVGGGCRRSHGQRERAT